MSDYRDPTTWRGITPGGVRFRLVDSTGGFEQENSVVTETYLIQTSQLLQFYVECFPAPTITWGVPIFDNRILPGTNMRARRMSFKGHVPGLPIDPFNRDPDAVSGTYQRVCEVQVEYDNQRQTVDPTEPQTFLTVRGIAAGEFLNIGTSDSKWVPIGGGTPDPNAAVNVPCTMIVPEVQWDVTWEQVPRQYFADTLIHRLRDLMGKVNSDEFAVIFDAPPETLLFAGYDFEETRSRFVDDSLFELITNISPDDATIFADFIRVSMKFLEKRIKNPDHVEGNDDEYFGHNHIWQPDIGWRRLLVDKTNTVYRTAPFTDLFATIDEGG